MSRPQIIRTALAVVAILTFASGRVRADEIRALEAFPDRVTLRGSIAAQQLVITANSPEGRSTDVSAAAAYRVLDPGSRA